MALLRDACFSKTLHRFLRLDTFIVFLLSLLHSPLLHLMFIGFFNNGNQTITELCESEILKERQILFFNHDNSSDINLYAKRLH